MTTQWTQEELDALMDTLQEMVLQNCGVRNGVFDSGGIGSNNVAIRMLVEHGRMAFYQDYGLRIFATVVKRQKED